MDTKTLIAAMSGDYPAPVHDVDYAAMTPLFNKALVMAKCTTVERVAMWCGQVGPESGMLRWMQELASGSDYDRYINPDGPWSQLGNIYAGDGVKFKGRGPIQLTGRHNYTKFSRWAYDNQARLGIQVPSSTYFVQHPEAVVAKKYLLGFLAAVWYWTEARNMNSYADRQDILGATKAVNGGTSNLEGRTKVWKHALTLGSALLPAGFEPDPLGEIMAMYASKAAFETALRKIVREEVQLKFEAFTRIDGEDTTKPSPGHFIKTVVSTELDQAIPRIVAALKKATK